MKSVGDIFFEMMKVILPLLQLTETCQTDNNNSNNMIRDALHPLIQQYINFLPFDKVYSIIYELYMKSIIYQNSNTSVLRFSVEEMNRLLKLLCQCLKKGQESFESNGSNEECLRDMIALLPPLFTTIVHTFGDINPFEKIKHNVISQMDKEMVEVHANFILYVFNVFSEESTALLFWTFAGQETLFFDALLTELGDGLCFPCNDLAIAAQSLRTIHKMICAHLSTWRGLEQAAAGGSPLPPLRYMYYSVLTNTADPTHPTAVSATKGYQQFQASLKNFIFPILLEKIISDFPLSVMGTDPAPAAKGNRTFNYKDMKNYIFLKEVVQLVRGLSFLFSPEMIHQLLMEILTTPYSNNNNNVVSSNLKNTVLRCLMEKRVKPEFVDSFVRFLVHNDNSKSDAPTTKTWNDAKQYDRVALLNYLSTFQNML
ncbi:hypothetical protein AGDE_16208 [Angomonas deanei]|nr:hypothetical protein AGDE_16208 [Angomonas deanei]|eukprot:EPY17519.1 hypothetical protein AGDE_16208 [Angomonas deanei]